MRTYTYLFALFLTGAAAFTDLRSGRIPNKLFRFSLIPSCILLLLEPPPPGGHALFLNLVLFLLLLVSFQRKILGGGDVKLFSFLLVLFPGLPGLLFLTFSFLLAAISLFLTGTKRIRLGGAAFAACMSFILIGGFYEKVSCGFIL